MKKVILGYIIITILFLSGCKTVTDDVTVSSYMTVDQIETDYQVTSFQLDESKTLEYRDVYHYNLSIVELENCGAYFVSTHLYLMDLNSKEIKEITSIHRSNDEGRIWNFLELSDKSYLYTEVTYPSLSDQSLMYFEVIHLEDNNKNVITKGYVNDIYSLPVFTVDNDSIYFTVSSLDYEEVEMNGNYRIEIWKFDTNKNEKIYSNIGRYTDYYLDDECEFLFDQKIHINDNKVYFISGNSYQTTMNKIENDSISKTPLTKKLVNATPLGNKILITEWLKNTAESDALISYVLDDHEVKYDLKATLRLGSYCVLEKGVVGFYNGEIVILKDLEDSIGMTVVPEIRDSAYFRKVDRNSVLIFKYGYCYYLTIK